MIDKSSGRLARWIRGIQSIATNADRYINACDYDIEGSVIGHTILQYACHGAQGNALRMRFSTMTEEELRSAFRNIEPKPDLGLVKAGKCRHELDWLYGINLSRSLTESTLKKGGGYSTLTTGRVQGPTLGFVVEREQEISCFVPIPFWTIDATIIHDDKIYELIYEEDKIQTQSIAQEICGKCVGATLEVREVESKQIRHFPPCPFDLSGLQSEAYRHFGFSPAKTLALAERLYLDALISYPRTSSQKLPPDIGYSEILRGLSRSLEYRALVRKLIDGTKLLPNNGPKTDSAHPAIYPTAESSKKPLQGSEAKLYDLIVRRFLATFAGPSLKTTTRIVLDYDELRFFLSGSVIVRPGWIEFYHPYVFEDTRPVPDLKIGDMVEIRAVEALEKFTRPPPRYNPSSLLKKMEEVGIGTKATRAGIVELLYKRGYVRDERMSASSLADSIIEVLVEHCPLVIDPAFTASLDDSLERIQDGTFSRRGVLVDALEHLRTVMFSLMEKGSVVGSRLSDVITSQRKMDTTFNSPCPRCGKKLLVVRNRGSGKRFVGCSGKWDTGCGFTLPLPQFGNLTLLSQHCQTCGFQMVQARSKGRRPLISCPLCYTTKSNEKGAASRPMTDSRRRNSNFSIRSRSAVDAS